MAVLQMQKLCICALKKDRKSLMEFLQAAGVLELSAEAPKRHRPPPNCHCEAPKGPWQSRSTRLNHRQAPAKT